MRTLIYASRQGAIAGVKDVLAIAGFGVVGEVRDGAELVSLARQLRPDLIVIDVAGLQALRNDPIPELIRQLPGTKIALLALNSDPGYVMVAVEIGELSSDAAADALADVLRVTPEHREPSTALGSSPPPDGADGIDLLQSWSRRIVAPPTQRALSPRETQVLKLLADGKSSKDIASCLGIGITTVETHRRQIGEKLNIRTIAELTKYAVREGLVSLD